MFEFQLNNKTYRVNTTRNRIDAICVFGSFQSNDFDLISDIDLLVIIENCRSVQKERTRTQIANELHVPKGWLSLYTKNEFLSKCTAGDYFCWSLKLNASILFMKTGFLYHAFDVLPRNISSVQTIQYDQSMLSKTLSQYTHHNVSMEELISTMAYCLRSLCIHLCYWHGIIEFGKYDAAEYCMTFSDVRMPFSMEEYKQLYELKRRYKNDSNSLHHITLPPNYLQTWYQIYKELLHEFYACYYRQRDHFITPLLYA